MVIGQIDSDYSLKITFDQVMKYPKELYPVEVYHNLFQISTISGLDSSVNAARFETRKLRSRLTDIGSALSFTWNVTEHTPIHIKIQLNYLNQSLVSTDEFPDSVQLKVLDTSLFQAVGSNLHVKLSESE